MKIGNGITFLSHLIIKFANQTPPLRGKAHPGPEAHPGHDAHTGSWQWKTIEKKLTGKKRTWRCEQELVVLWKPMRHEERKKQRRDVVRKETGRLTVGNCRYESRSYDIRLLVISKKQLLCLGHQEP